MNLRPALLPLAGFAAMSLVANAQPTTAPSDAVAARAAARTCLWAVAHGDIDAAVAAMTGEPAEVEAAKAMSSIFVAGRSLHKAMEAKFGVAVVNAAPDPFSLGQALAHYDRMEVAIRGDTAELRSPGVQHGEVILKKVDRGWKVESLTRGPGGNADMTSRLSATLAAVRDTKRAVDAGEYPSAEAASHALQARLRAVSVGDHATSTPSTRPQSKAP